MSLGEGSIIAIAKGCTSLETLGLEIGVKIDDFDGHYRLPSINHLVHLANHCPSLRDLGISLNLDAEIGDEVPSAPAHDLQNLRIFALRDPGELGWNQSNVIAKFLDTAFPTLNSVRGPFRRDSDWKSVETLVKLFQAARAHEGRRMMTASSAGNK
jgi:hypothetical protein